uniref:Uncharacterized protein n=1 Tax=Megaselia scalaris TaxID=36166 RepID=T1GER6_MEGSC
MERQIIVFCHRMPAIFNLPRISARLQRLMGTNVVRLTDRKYMQQLRNKTTRTTRINLQKGSISESIQWCYDNSKIQ